MNLWRLLRARLGESRARVLGVMCLTGFGTSVVIVGLAQRAAGNPSWEMPADLGGAVVAITIIGFGQTWASARFGRMLGGLSRQVRRTLITTYVGMEPAAMAATDKDAAYDAMVSVPRGLARLGTELPATLQSLVSALGCVAISLFIDPVAGAALLLALKLGAIAMAAQVARAPVGAGIAEGDDQSINLAAEQACRGTKLALLAAQSTAAAEQVKAAIAERHKIRRRRLAWVATSESIGGAGRLSLAVLLAAVTRLGGAPAGEAVAMMLIAFLIPLDWIAAIPQLTESSAGVDRLAAFEAALHECIRRWPVFSSEPAGDALGTWALCDAVFRYPALPGLPGAIVGPVSCQVESRRILVVTGGIGSGKTSVLSMLAGQTVPDGGQVLRNGISADVRQIRGLAAYVPADPVLFSGMPIPNIGDPDIQALTSDLELDGIPDVVAGRIPPEGALSRSVKGRIAFLIAVAARRPLIVLDEWDAWQSPAMRARYFGSILPRLRDMGLAVVLSTRDERHIGLADEILRLA